MMLSKSGYGAVLMGALLFSGCGLLGGDDKKDADVEETGVDITKNPFGAIKQLAEVGKEMQEKHEEMAQREPVDPVSFRALMKLLPQETGWEESGKASGQTTQMGEYKISQATGSYKKTVEGKRPTMKVTIVDGGFVPMVYAPFAMMSKFATESSDGHSKGLKVDGHPAFEEWKSAQGRVTLTILVADRFLVTIEGRDVGEKEARTWASHVDLSLLKKWAKDGVSSEFLEEVEEVTTKNAEE